MIRERAVRIPPEQDRARLDQAVAQLFGQSRGWARRVIELGGVYLDGSRLRLQSLPVRAGQLVQVCWAEPPETPPAPLTEAAILHQGRGWVVIDKPAGIHAQAARHRLVGTLPELTARLLGLRTLPEPVHRLDRDTSGSVVLAWDRRVRAQLAEHWRAGRVRKRYLALVQGPGGEEAGPLCDRLTRDEQRPGCMRLAAPGEEGQEATTNFRKLEARDIFQLLELEPLTGRTHQLRVQLAARGWPILGDSLYAPPGMAATAPRLCLHAAWLSLPDPEQAVRLRIIHAPVPHDFWRILSRLGFQQDGERTRGGT